MKRSKPFINDVGEEVMRRYMGRWWHLIQIVLSNSSHRFGGVVFPLSVNLQEEQNEKGESVQTFQL